MKILSHPGHGYPMRVELRATGRRESLPRRLNNHLHAVRTEEAPLLRGETSSSIYNQAQLPSIQPFYVKQLPNEETVQTKTLRSLEGQKT